MTKITGIDYLKMSKYDIYKEYCKIYNELENISTEYLMRMKKELNDANIELMLSCLQKPIESEE